MSDRTVSLQGDQITAFAALTVAHALELYAKHGVKVNRLYTPGAMMRTAERMTGKSFGKRDYLGAAAALRGLAGQPAEAPHA